MDTQALEDRITFPSDEVSDPGSLARRVQRRAQEIAAETPIDLDVPGYEGVLVARYHPLSYTEVAKIQNKHRRLPEAQQNLFAAADYLIAACDDILERKGDALVSTGYVWGSKIATEVWGKAHVNSARGALLAIYAPPRDLELVAHANEVLEASRAANAEVDEDLAGESDAS